MYSKGKSAVAFQELTINSIVICLKATVHLPSMYIQRIAM